MSLVAKIIENLNNVEIENWTWRENNVLVHLQKLTAQEVNDLMDQSLPHLKNAAFRNGFENIFTRYGSRISFMNNITAQTIAKCVDYVIERKSLSAHSAHAIAANCVNTAGDTLVKLFHAFPMSDTYNDPNIRVLSHYEKCGLVGHKNFPQGDMSKLVTKEHRYLYDTLAYNLTDPKAIYKLAQYVSKGDIGYWTVRGICKNKNADASLLEKIAKLSDRFAEEVASHRKTKADFLNKLAENKKANVRSSAARNAKIDPKVMEKLSDDNEPDVLYNLARNRKASIEIRLKAFARIPDSYVWKKRDLLKDGELCEKLSELARQFTHSEMIQE